MLIDVYRRRCLRHLYTMSGDSMFRRFYEIFVLNNLFSDVYVRVTCTYKKKANERSRGHDVSKTFAVRLGPPFSERCAATVVYRTFEKQNTPTRKLRTEEEITDKLYNGIENKYTKINISYIRKYILHIKSRLELLKKIILKKNRTYIIYCSSFKWLPFV